MLKKTKNFASFLKTKHFFHRQRGRVKRRACDQRGLGSKPTRVILWCLWERHFTALSSIWWSWQAVLNFRFELYLNKV